MPIKPMHAEKWGWWVNIRDSASANYAIKMSGLPVFLLGIQFTIIGLVILLTWSGIQANPGLFKYWLLAMMPVGLALIVCGLMLRKNVNAIAPISAVIYIPFVVVSLFFVRPAPDVGANTMLFINILFSALVIVMSLGGLRGWRWLRKNS